MRQSQELDFNTYLDKKQKRASELVTIGREVGKTLKSKGWSKTIGPLMDKMIKDIVGGQYKGRWSAGQIQKARKDERREYYIGYKQGLIDLHNRIFSYADNVDKLEETIAEIIKEREAKDSIPMVEE